MLAVLHYTVDVIRTPPDTVTELNQRLHHSDTAVTRSVQCK
jgi:hypothetical protein